MNIKSEKIESERGYPGHWVEFYTECTYLILDHAVQIVGTKQRASLQQSNLAIPDTLWPEELFQCPTEYIGSDPYNSFSDNPDYLPFRNRIFHAPQKLLFHS